VVFAAALQRRILHGGGLLGVVLSACFVFPVDARPALEVLGDFMRVFVGGCRGSFRFAVLVALRC
jgi:hypothetical protein